MKLLAEFRRKLPGTIAVMIFLLFTMAPNKTEAHAINDVSFDVFYHELSPYGTWFTDAQYGYVWAPAAGPDFRPYYSNGHWAYTDYGNMWVSGYDWGWATFHYGRWIQKNRIGWVWVPGNTWGPAWVTWRQGGGYYGWAPMGPGMSVSFSFGSRYHMPANYWTFIPYGNLYVNDYHRYYFPSRNTTIINQTIIINNTYINDNSTYVAGPSRRDIKLRTGRDVQPYRISNSSGIRRASVQGENINVYRPEVEHPSRREISESQNERANVGATRGDYPNLALRNEISSTESRSTVGAERSTRTNRSSETQMSSQSRSEPSKRVAPEKRVNPPRSTQPVSQRITVPTQPEQRNPGNSAKNSSSSKVRTSSNTSGNRASTPTRSASNRNATSTAPSTRARGGR